MRVSTEPLPHTLARRRSVWLLVALVLLVVLVVVLQGLAGFYVNYLWFQAAHVGEVWRALVVSKLGLSGTFVILAMTLVWSSLWLADKIAQRTLFLPTESDLVRRYRTLVLPHAFVLRTAASLLVGLALGTGTSSQWQHWLLFEHAVNFNKSDPVFGRDDSFFVFRLPFLSFLVDWILVALLVTLVLTAIAHFLSGTIRTQGARHLEPRAVAHLSLILGAMALVRAWAYYFVDRYTIDLPHGSSPGASYTDVQVRLPAMTLLAVVSLVAFVMLVVNVYQRTLVLPVIALGLWALIALAIGVIYPSVQQAVAVSPAQKGLVGKYLSDNVGNTQFAMGIGNVTLKSFSASHDLNTTVLAHYRQTIDDASLWDAAPATSAFGAEDEESFYSVGDVTANRMIVNGRLEPLLVGVRELATSKVASPTWENLELVFTHGYGAVVAPSNTASGGSPSYLLSGIDSRPATGAPTLTAAGNRVYFSPEGRRYVIVDTKLHELDYQTPGLQPGSSSYSGSSAVSIGSFWPRLAFAVKLRDFNLLVSSLITPSSKILYLTGVRQRVEKSLPFFRIDTNPYAVIADGKLYWVLNAYATTSYFPDAALADTSMLPAGSALGGHYDYVRDAAVAVVDATTGSMRFYALDQSDPLVTSYENTYPHLLQPYSALAAFDGGQVLRQLRYPQDLMTVQATMYGAYGSLTPHDLSLPAQRLAPAASATGASGGSAGVTANGEPAPYQPQYELIQLSGDSRPTFFLVEPLVPYALPGGEGPQSLSALLLARSDASPTDPSSFGQLSALVVPSSNALGPTLAAGVARTVGQSQVAALAAQGAHVSFGTVEALPIVDSLVYVIPVYVTASGARYPTQRGAFVVYGKQVALAATPAAALDSLLGGGSGASPRGSTTVPAQVAADIRKAAAYYEQAQAELKKGQAGVSAYLNDLKMAAQLSADAERALTASTRQPSSLRAGKGSSAGRTAAAPRGAAPAPSTVNGRPRAPANA